MSDPLGALSEGATPPYQTSDPSAVAAKEVFRRRLLTTCTQSLIVNPSNDTTTSKPPPPPPPEYAPPSPPRRGTVLGIPGGKAPAGLVASSDGGRNVTSQLIPSKPSSVPKSSYAAAAAAVEQRLLHKSINGQGGGGKDDPHNGGVRSPIPKSMGYRPRQRQPSSSDTSADTDGLNITAFLLTALSVLLIVITVPFSLCLVIKVVAEYERAVIFRLGRLRKGGSKGPGIFTVIPCIDTYRCVDLRTVSFDVPPQEILSRDSVTVAVDAVVYYRVSNPTICISNVENFSHSTRLLAATTLRNVLGTKNLAEILSERETISHIMQSSLDEATDPWGVKVERVEIKDVRLPVQLQRAMAAEAEAAREARAKVIAAEGEQKASHALKEAAQVIQESPSALQLRYLQTLTSISAEKNSTIIFPLPIDFISHFVTK